MLTTAVQENPQYLLVIHTDQYAGNFEREMCAYVTGYIGECGVGSKGSAKFKEDFGITEDVDLFYVDKYSEIVDERADEHGTWRPVVLLEPNTSFGIFLIDPPSKEVMEIWMPRIVAFCDNPSRCGATKKKSIQVKSVTLEKHFTVRETVKLYS